MRHTLRLRTLPGVAALVFLFLPSALSQSPLPAPDTGRLSGIVRSTTTGEPISGARVDLSGDRLPASQTRYTRTDSAGRFTFSSLPDGPYRLSADRESYGQFDDCCNAELKAGQAIDRIVIELVPMGAISGVVRERGRSPLPLITVRLVREVYFSRLFEFAEVSRRLEPVAATETNDRGEYRFFNLAPGKYHIRVGTTSGSVQPRVPYEALDTDFNGVSRDARIPYSRQFHPGEADFNRAVEIEILPGAVMTGLDFWLTRQETHRVRGRVVESRTGKPPAGIGVAMKLMGDLDVDPPTTGVEQNLSYDPATGAFELRDVFPGNHLLVVTVAKTGGAYVAGTAFAQIQVGDKDVEGVTVTLAPNGTLFGRVIVGGQETAPKLPVSPPVLNLQTTFGGERIYLPDDAPDVTINASILGPRPTQNSSPFQSDGTFRADNIRPGEFRLIVRGLQTGYFVKEARLNGIDAKQQSVVIGGAESGPLTIVISTRGATVSGQVVNDQDQPAAAHVALVSGQSPLDSNSLFTTLTDEERRFTIRNLSPGDYWVLALPQASFELVQRAPDLVRRYGTPIHLTEGVNPDLRLKSITPPAK
jgi:hypothetical protein